MLQNICISGESSAVRVRLSLIISFDILKQRSIPAVDVCQEKTSSATRAKTAISPWLMQPWIRNGPAFHHVGPQRQRVKAWFMHGSCMVEWSTLVRASGHWIASPLSLRARRRFLTQLKLRSDVGIRFQFHPSTFSLLWRKMHFNWWNSHHVPIENHEKDRFVQQQALRRYLRNGNDRFLVQRPDPVFFTFPGRN